jgi:hypothetical protein
MEPSDNPSKYQAIPSSTISPFDDTLVLNSAAAVIIEPDSIQIEKSKRASGEADFYAGADDYLYYLNLAQKFLDSVKMKTVVAKDKRFILFIGNEKSFELIKTDTLSELWTIYFFDPEMKAKKIDMTAIEEEYKRYFKLN